MTHPAPARSDFDDFPGNAHAGAALHVERAITDVMSVNAYVSVRENADSLLCLLPSAQSASQPQMNPVFHRWTWQHHFPESHVLALSDPALYLSGEIRAAWFMDPARDVIADLADFVRGITGVLGVPATKTVFYGSSMGGFGALMAASEMDGSTAVAEIPQIDMRNYPIRSAVTSLEKEILGCTIAEHHSRRPEQVNVIDRFQKTGRVPRFRIVTNSADQGFGEHQELLTNIGLREDQFATIADQELHLVSDVRGHAPLRAERLAEIVRATVLTPGTTRIPEDSGAVGAA